MIKRLRQRVWIALAGVAVTVAASWLILWLLVLPALVRSRVEAALADAGLRNVSFQVKSASLSEARLADVRLGGNDSGIDRAFITYAWRGGKLHAITLQGLTLALLVDDHGHVNFPISAPTKHNASAPFSIERIAITASQILIRSPSQQFKLPVEATLIADQGGRLSIEAKTDLGGEATITGDIDPSHATGRLHLSSPSADAYQLSEFARIFARGLPFAVSAQLHTEATLAFSDAGKTIDAQVTATSAETRKLGPANLKLTAGVLHLVGQLAEQSSLQIRATGANFSIDDSLQTQGLGGDLHLTGLAPIASAPDQRVSAQNLKVGGLELSDGFVEFQVIDAQAIHVKRTQWNWLGGHLFAGEFDIKGASADIPLQLRDVELGKLLILVANKQASGDGRLSGFVNLKINGSHLAFGGGRITSLSAGALQIAQPEAFVGQAVAAGPQSVQQRVQSNIVEALKDFVYDSLTMELKPQGKELAADITIVGHGRTGAKQAITYEPRITGLNSLLGSVLGLRQMLSDAQNDVRKKAQ